MYKPYVTVETTGTTAAEIEKALEQSTGISGWIDDEADLSKQIREGFIKIDGNTVTVYHDEF